MLCGDSTSSLFVLGDKNRFLWLLFKLLRDWENLSCRFWWKFLLVALFKRADRRFEDGSLVIEVLEALPIEKFPKDL